MFWSAAFMSSQLSHWPPAKLHVRTHRPTFTRFESNDFSIQCFGFFLVASGTLPSLPLPSSLFSGHPECAAVFQRCCELLTDQTAALTGALHDLEPAEAEANETRSHFSHLLVSGLCSLCSGLVGHVFSRLLIFLSCSLPPFSLTAIREAAALVAPLQTLWTLPPVQVPVQVPVPRADRVADSDDSDD